MIRSLIYVLIYKIILIKAHMKYRIVISFHLMIISYPYSFSMLYIFLNITNNPDKQLMQY